MTVAITCAGCRRSLRVDEGLVGQSVQCPLCIETFVAEADAIQPAPLPKQALRRAVLAPGPEDRPGDAASEPPAAVGPTPAVAARPTQAFRPLTFAVLLAHDPDRLLHGRADAELSVDGLRVRLRSRRDLWAGVCGQHPARYVGGNRLAVFLDGREVTLTLVRRGTDLNRLARDVVAYLNGGRASLDLRDYRLPWKLTLLPWLAVLVPFLAIWLRVLGGVHGGGRFLWFLLAGATLLFTWFAVRRETSSNGWRLALAGTYLGAFLLLLAGAFTYRVLNPNAIPSREWQPFAVPGQRFRVLMPGRPWSTNRPVTLAGLNTAVYTVDRPELNKTFELGIATVDRDRDAHSVLDSRRRLLENELPHSSIRYHNFNQKIGDASVQIELRLSYGANDAYRLQMTRLILAGDQLYSLTVKGEDAEADDADVKKFFESFRLVTTVPPPSPRELSGVVAYWSFEDEDRVKEGREAYQNVGSVQGVRGQAAVFRGPGSFINLNNSGDALNFGENQPFSCVGWVKTQTWDPKVYLVSLHGQNAVRLEVFLQNGSVEAELNTFPGGDQRALGGALRGPAVNDGAWHHFALTRGEAGTVTLYVDGIRTATDFGGGGMTSGPLTTSVRSLGCRRTSPWNPPEGHLTGMLDEVAFYNRCLSAEDVGRLSQHDVP
jgi:hypothetical protein